MEMKRLLAASLVVLSLASSVQAECYADYKAKQGNPLKLHYGVVQVPDNACNPPAAAAVVRSKLERAGWTLLNVISTFGPDGLAERKNSAGAYFLAF